MKQVIECLSCGKTVPIRSCYMAEKELYTENLTGELKKQSKQGYICALCNKRMGFKTSNKKLEMLKRMESSLDQFLEMIPND